MGLTNEWWVWAGKPIGASDSNDNGLTQRQIDVRIVKTF